MTLGRDDHPRSPITSRAASPPDHPIAMTDLAGNLTYVSPSLVRLWNYDTAQELLGHSVADLCERPAQASAALASLQEKNESVDRWRARRKDGSGFDILCSAHWVRPREPGQPAFAVFSFLDAAQHEQLAREREATAELLRLMNASDGLHDLMRAVTAFMRSWSGCDAVGIRLRDGDDYPYFETRGFPEEFVRAENQLCTRDAEGMPIRDGQGNPVLECMCGNILCGRFDPSKPFFSKGGSFWSNCTTKLLASTTEADRQARTRNRCNGEGYESVALIPIRTGDETFGLLQFNDKREGRFTPELIAFLEGVGTNLAIGLAHRKAAAALQESERRARAVLDASTDAVVLIDSVGTVLECNEEHARRFHRSRRDLLGTNIFGIMPPDVAQRRRRAVEEVLRTSRMARFEDEREGIWNDVTICPVLDGEGTVKAIVVHAADITSQKQSERRLRESESRFRQLAVAIREVFWLGDPDWNEVHYISPAYEEVWRKSCQSLYEAPRSWLESILPEDVPAVLSAIPSHGFEGLDRIEFPDYRVRRPDGSTRWISARAFPIRDEQGRVCRIAGIAEDITERKRSEAQTRKTAKEWQTTFDAAGDAVWLMDSDCRILRCNKMGAEAFGRTVEEMVGRHCWEVTHGTTRMPSDCPFLRLKESLKRESCEAAVGDRWHLITLDPILDEAGGLAGVVHIMSDVTERKRAEHALRENEERYRLALKATNDVVWDWDVVSDTQRWNEAGMAVFGWSDIVEHPQSAAWWTERVHPDDYQRVHDSFFAVVNDPAAFHWRDEYRFRKSDGSYARVFDRGYVMRDAQGRAVRMIGAMLDVTERRRAEEALRESEARLKDTAKAGNVGLWDWNLSTNRVYYSPEWKSQIGYEDHEISNDFSEWQSRVHPEDLDRAVRIVQDFIRKPWPNFSNEFRFRHKNGSYRWILAQASLLCDAAGQPERMLGSHLDITERKQAEEELRASEARFRSYFELPLIGIAITSPDKGWLEVNDRLCEILGYPREELVRMTWVDVTHPEDLAPDVANFTRVLAGESQGYSMDKRFVRKDGRIIHASIAARCIRKPDGCVDYFIALVQDVTDRRSAERELRESEQKYRIVADNTYDWEFWVDPERRFLYCSPSCLRITDHEAAEFMAEPNLLPQLIHPNDRDAYAAHVKEALSEKRPRELLFRIVRPDGTERWIGHVCQAVLDDNGAVLGRRGSNRDITEQKHAEERSARLQAQLWQIQKLDALGRMAAGIAHDFSNYLSVIRANSQSILKTASLDQKANESLRMIQQAAEESLDITRSLLTFSRGSPSPTQVVNLREAIGSARILIRQALPKNIRLDTEFTCKCACPVRLDVTQLHQVLLNLSLNARDAMPDGGTLRIATTPCPAAQPEDERHPAEPDRHLVRITISDTGQGMTPETLAHIFEPFFTTKERGKGSGLGLPIVHGLVESWGGRIEVQSQPGEGTTFSITIPLAESAESGEKNAARLTVPAGEGQTVLLVGIEPYLRSFIEPTLMAQGYNVVAADVEDAAAGKLNGAAAAVRLLIFDAHLHGSGLSEPLRATLRRFAETPAIVLAGKGHSLGDELNDNVVVVEEPYSLGDVVAAASHLLDTDKQETITP